MTEDRFEQIKSGWSRMGYTDVDWLLKEVERLRKANEIMHKALTKTMSLTEENNWALSIQIVCAHALEQTEKILNE